MGILIVALLAAATPLPADLAAAVKAYDTAQAAGDRAALERLLADDYVLANSEGRTETKAEFIADLTAPGLKTEPLKIDHPIERVWADGAVLGGVATLRGVMDGTPFSTRLRFNDVWARRGGRWQVIYTQAAQAVAGE